jgi:hypothetical protein
MLKALNPTIRLAQLRQMINAKTKRRNTFGDRLIIEDEVLVYEGEGENKKLLFKSKGHIVNQGLIALINLLAVAALNYLPSSSWGSTGTIRLGTDTTTPTGGGTTGLTAEITTQANAHSGATGNPAANQYRVSWVATWNAGTISGTIGEMGLKLYISPTLQSFGAAAVSATPNTLFSRLSVADGDFTAFTINTAVPLTIEWRLTLTFA